MSEASIRKCGERGEISNVSEMSNMTVVEVRREMRYYGKVEELGYVK